jgi:hypothetical protein
VDVNNFLYFLPGFYNLLFTFGVSWGGGGSLSANPTVTLAWPNGTGDTLTWDVHLQPRNNGATLETFIAASHPAYPATSTPFNLGIKNESGATLSFGTNPPNAVLWAVKVG